MSSPDGVIASTSFTRMDESTAEHWAVIKQHQREHRSRVADRVLLLMRSLGDITDGFSTDQLTHCLQTATLAERAGADLEVTVAAACHDIGKAVSTPNHGPIAAEIFRPYVRPDVAWMLEVHQHFQGRFYYGFLGLDPDRRNEFAGHPAYDLTARFADEWDQVAFDPDAETFPLEHFEPMIRKVFAKPRY